MKEIFDLTAALACSNFCGILHLLRDAHEVKLAANTLVQMVIPDPPQNLIGDNAYDSDKLDSELRQYGIELIAPHRLIAWLPNFRRLVVRLPTLR